MPPIYQPEVCARFILEVALDGRRDKVIGSCNKLLVMAAQLVPGFANQYAAVGAWGTQLIDQPVRADRPDNLRQPVDAQQDAGAHGIFDDKAGGFLDPSFLSSLPATATATATATAKNFAMAVGRVASEKQEAYRNVIAERRKK